MCLVASCFVFFWFFFWKNIKVTTITIHNFKSSNYYQIYRYCTLVECGELKMTDNSKSAYGGYSVYFDGSHAEWWKDEEFRVLNNWIEGMIHSKIKLYRKPDDKILAGNLKDSITMKIRKMLKQTKEQGTKEEDIQSSPVQERAVLVIIPVNSKIVNVMRYIKECVPKFCEENVTANKDAVCVVSVDGLMPSDVEKLVHKLNITLENYDMQIFSGIGPKKGPVTCLCLHVSI